MGRDNGLQPLGFSYGMSEAIKLGLSTKNFPNPNVGAALVSIQGEIIATGFHKGKNTDHAEIDLLNNIKKNNIDTDQSILYVTLEPCMHKDTSPSCASELIKSNLFKDIIIGDIDPDFRTNGKGYEFLLDNGINVLLEAGATKFLDPAYVNSQMMFHRDALNISTVEVIIKAGVSKNNYIYSSSKNDRYITSNQSRKLSHYLRGTVDAIIVGKNTLMIDEPELNIRHGINAVDPDVYILWGNDESLYEEYLFKYPSFKFLIGFEHDDHRSHSLGEELKTNNLAAILSYLEARGVKSLLVEGGNSTWNTFLPAAKQIYIFKSPHSVKSGKMILEHLDDINVHRKLTKKIKLSEDTLSIYNNAYGD